MIAIVESKKVDTTQILTVLQPLTPSHFNSLVPRHIKPARSKESAVLQVLSTYILTHPDVPIWSYTFYKDLQIDTELMASLPFSFLLSQSMFPTNKNGGVYLDDEKVRDCLSGVVDGLEHGPSSIRIQYISPSAPFIDIFFDMNRYCKTNTSNSRQGGPQRRSCAQAQHPHACGVSTSCY